MTNISAVVTIAAIISGITALSLLVSQNVYAASCHTEETDIGFEFTKCSSGSSSHATTDNDHVLFENGDHVTDHIHDPKN